MMAHFNPVTPELVADLKRVLSDKQVKTDEEYLTAYQTDEEGNSYYFHKPEVVVFPETTEQVADVVKLANQYRAQPARVLPAELSRCTTVSLSNWNA